MDTKLLTVKKPHDVITHDDTYAWIPVPEMLDWQLILFFSRLWKASFREDIYNCFHRGSIPFELTERRVKSVERPLNRPLVIFLFPYLLWHRVHDQVTIHVHNLNKTITTMEDGTFKDTSWKRRHTNPTLPALSCILKLWISFAKGGTHMYFISKCFLFGSTVVQWLALSPPFPPHRKKVRDSNLKAVNVNTCLSLCVSPVIDCRPRQMSGGIYPPPLDSPTMTN